MNRLTLVTALSFVALAGCKKDEPVAVPQPQIVPAVPKAPPAPPADLAKMVVDKASGWEGEYNAALKSWSVEKYTPTADGTNAPNRFYVDLLPEDAPADVEAYAAKLAEKDWQDIGFVYASIDAKAGDADGFVIKGQMKDTGDATAKPEPGFVALRVVGGTKIRCKAGAMTSQKLRDEAIAACQGAKF